MKDQISLVRWCVLLACALATAAGYIGASPPAYAQQSNSGSAQKPVVAVFTFAVQSQPTRAAALSSQACPADDNNRSSNFAEKSNGRRLDPAVLDAVTDELQSRLEKSMTIVANARPTAIPIGALAIEGCIFQSQAENSTKRSDSGENWVGVNVMVLYRAPSGLSPLESFDVQTKARAVPSSSPKFAGTSIFASSEILTADGKKLADEIVKKLNNDMKQQGWFSSH